MRRPTKQQRRKALRAKERAALADEKRAVYQRDYRSDAAVKERNRTQARTRRVAEDAIELEIEMEQWRNLLNEHLSRRTRTG